MKKIVFTLTILVCSTSLCISQNRCDYYFVNRTSHLQLKVDSLQTVTDPGFSMLVGKDDKILFEYATGLKNLQTKKKITIETPFYAASIGKTFTSWAILKLFEEKKLKLEDKLSNYFPDFPSFAGKVTLYHMLNHTSGLPDHYDTFGVNTELTNDKVISFVSEQDSLLFEPGYDYAYSNSAYVLLAEIIQKVTGKPYGDYISNTFLIPLSMNHTFIYGNPALKTSTKATGYTKEDQKWSTNDYENNYTTGAGGIYTTVRDLFKWYKAIKDNRFLKPQTTELAFNTPFLVTGTHSYMGMGWFNETFGRRTPEVQGLKVYGAIGILKGFRANLHYFPDQDFVFIMLSNAGDFPIRSHEVAEIYFQR